MKCKDWIESYFISTLVFLRSVTISKTKAFQNIRQCVIIEKKAKEAEETQTKLSKPKRLTKFRIYNFIDNPLKDISPDLKMQSNDENEINSSASKDGENGDDNDWCAVCHDGGDTLYCCDRCPKVYHMYCFIPTLTEEPPDDWVYLNFYVSIMPFGQGVKFWNWCPMSKCFFTFLFTPWSKRKTNCSAIFFIIGNHSTFSKSWRCPIMCFLATLKTQQQKSFNIQHWFQHSMHIHYSVMPPEFGSSVNPIKTKGADYAHHTTACPPKFENLAAC